MQHSSPSGWIRRPEGVALAVVAVIALTACAQGDAPLASSPSGDATASAAAPSEAASGGTYTIALTDSAFGRILAEADGRTLYRFTPDSHNTSTCSSTCAENWPPVVPTDGAIHAGDGVTAELGTMTRDDGRLQVTVDGFPVYYFAGDTGAGDANGQNVGDQWFVMSGDGEINSDSAAVDY